MKISLEMADRCQSPLDGAKASFATLKAALPRAFD